MGQETKRILFASPHCLIDFSSGAAVATGDAMKLLAAWGFELKTFCASKLDLPGEGRFEQMMVDAGVRSQGAEVREQRSEVSSRVVDFQLGGMPVTVLRTASTQVGLWAPGEAETLLRAFERVLSEFRPDVLLTYGGDAVAQAMIGLAKQRGVTVVFWLHNFAYNDPAPFRDVDRTIVPSEFSARYYRERLGLECRVMPYAIDWGRVRVGQHRPAETPHPNPLPQGERGQELARGFVTFVNPQPAKGLFVFARIAEQLARRRPDIPILVVESRGAAAWLEQTGLDLSWATNLHAMDNTQDPRDFYGVTKLLLVPSLWNESFGLVAVEAMINGIPVLASHRGALPEVVGGERPEVGDQRSEVRTEGGFLFDIPERYRPETTIVPTAEEVEPWVQTIIRLWDDEALYGEFSGKTRTHALRWHPDRVGPMYVEFFENVRPQTGPPFVRSQVSGVRGQGPEGRVQKSAIGNQRLAISDQQSFGLTSIILVTHNQLEYTRLCVESMQRHTKEP